jgi:hypothetical protein
MKQREMEDRLEAIGERVGRPLPRDCWRQGFNVDILRYEPAPADHLGFVIIANTKPGEFFFYDWLKLADDEARWEAYCAACAAWSVHMARSTRRPEVRFRFGRLLDACEVNLGFKERLRDEYRRRARDARIPFQEASEPLYDLLRIEGARLRASGLSENRTADLLAAREDVQALARSRNGKPITARGVRDRLRTLLKEE